MSIFNSLVDESQAFEPAKRSSLYIVLSGYLKTVDIVFKA